MKILRSVYSEMKKLFEQDRNKLRGYAGFTVAALGFAAIGMLLLCRSTGIIEPEEISRLFRIMLVSGIVVSGVVGFAYMDAWQDTLRSQLESENLNLSALLEILMQQKNVLAYGNNTVAAARRLLALKLIGSKEGDYPSLSSQHRKFLYQYLDSRDDRLVHGILAIVMNAEDKQATPWLNQLGEGRWSAAYNKSVQLRAQECLALLQARAIEERNADTLLRSSSAFTAPAELLRPAENAYAEPEAESQLLRPTFGSSRE